MIDEMKSRFFANISHEFRTPLTLILGPIRKWRERFANEQQQRHPERSRRVSGETVTGFDFAQPDVDEMHKDLTMAERNAQRLLRLINQLLDLSKLEGGAMKLQTSRGNIVPFVKGLTSSFESSADMRRVAVSIHADRDEIEVYFDKDKLEKILTNLLSNAFKFTPEGGEVTVAVYRHSDSALAGEESDSSAIRQIASVAALPRNDGAGFVTIAIADTGIGIPAEELPRVFDRFYQVDSSQTREHEGSGIGLALTKELVELHHGSISVKSEVGKRTEFTVTLPLGREHLKDDEIVEEPPLGVILSPAQAVDRVRDARLPVMNKGGGQEESETKNQMLHPTFSRDQRDHDSVGQKSIVLVVEDNADVRAYMREHLVSGYDVQEAHDGEEGIDKAKEIIPDLIISDVMMPKKDGYELCQTLKSDEKTSHIPIILLTAKAGTENKIEGLETGADDYLTKPFDAKELLVRAKNLIDLRRKLRERFSVGQVLKPGDIAVTSIDDAFLKKAMSLVERRMGDEEFGVEQLRDELGMSRTQLHRKLTALTNQSAGDFIRYMRLQRAKDLLTKNGGTVSEIAYQVGFSSVAYFTKCFREQFGTVPSEVRKR
jgi:signal transduction histidine kinase/DNA-binding response OmpR family regulator